MLGIIAIRPVRDRGLPLGSRCLTRSGGVGFCRRCAARLAGRAVRRIADDDRYATRFPVTLTPKLAGGAGLAHHFDVHREFDQVSRASRARSTTVAYSPAVITRTPVRKPAAFARTEGVIPVGSIIAMTVPSGTLWSHSSTSASDTPPEGPTEETWASAVVHLWAGGRNLGATAERAFGLPNIDENEIAGCERIAMALVAAHRPHLRSEKRNRPCAVHVKGLDESLHRGRVLKAQRSDAGSTPRRSDVPSSSIQERRPIAPKTPDHRKVGPKNSRPVSPGDHHGARRNTARSAFRPTYQPFQKSRGQDLNL